MSTKDKTKKKGEIAVRKQDDVMLAANFSLEDIPAYLEKVEEELERIEEELDGNSHAKAGLLEIQDRCFKGEAGRGELTLGLAQILRKEEFFKKAAKVLGHSQRFTFKGLSMTTVRKAYNVEYQRSILIEKMQKLKGVKDELEKYLTDDHKAKAAFKNLSNLLAKD